MGNSGKIAEQLRRGDYEPPVSLEEKVAKESFWERHLVRAEKSEIVARNTLAAIEALEQRLEYVPRAMRYAKEFVEREVAKYEIERKNSAFKRIRKL